VSAGNEVAHDDPGRELGYEAVIVTDAKGVIETVVFRQLYLKHIDENLFIYFADFSRANRQPSGSDPEYLDSGKPEKDLWQRNLNWLREVAD
jgi:hypothetical protein